MELRYSDPTKFPLHALLLLYAGGHARDLFCDHFYGLRILIDWLGPIGIPDLESIQIPRLHGNYDIQRIAALLGCDESIVYQVARLLWNPTHD